MKRFGLIAVAAAAFVVVGLRADVGIAQSSAAETYDDLRLFGDVFTLVRANYIDPVSDEKLIEGAINGMLTALDPHSDYLNAENYNEMMVETRGEFGGLGVEVWMDKGLFRVISPIDGTPAAHAGLKPGDLITHIDGAAVQGMTPSVAFKKMRGPVDSDVTLTIQRAGRQPFDVKLTRAVIKFQSVHSRLETGDIGYIRISRFTEQTDTGLNEAMQQLEQKADEKLAGVVLDLRNNPGGLLDQAVAVANAFIGRGEIVSTRGRRPDDAQRYDAQPNREIASGLPMAVLINGGSASASEIVAGALKDHHRAILIGTRSFGKGSVQTIIQLPLGHGAMRLTTARYYTPSGRSIQAEGIEPDIVIPAEKIERKPATDSGKTGQTNLSSAAADEDSAASTIIATPDDYQLARAVDMLRGIAKFAPRVN